MDRNARLALVERRSDEAPDLIDHGMGYGVAADRGAAAMHHQGRSGAPLLPVERIGEAEIEGEMLDAIRVELLARHPVEPLRRLPVALFELRPEPPRPQANGISGEANEATIFLNPKLKLHFELEDAQVNRRAELCTMCRKSFIKTRKVGVPGKGSPAWKRAL